MQAGDALLHDILLVHGSPACESALRRVLYYEFRPAEVELRRGPHTPDYLPLKQRVMLACLRERAGAPWARGETPFRYRPSAAFPVEPLAAGERLATLRHPHHEHWRWDLEKARAAGGRLDPVAPRAQAGGVTIDVRRILVPLDFSEHSEAVLEWAAHLAEEHGSRVLLLHAYHLPVEFQQLEGAYLPDDFWADGEGRDRAEPRALRRAAARPRARGRDPRPGGLPGDGDRGGGRAPAAPT